MHLTHGQAGPGPRCSGRCRGRGKARGAHEPLPRLCAGPRHRINGEAVPLPHPRQGTPSPGTGNQARVPVDEDSAPYSVEDSGADDGGLAGPASLTGPRTRQPDGVHDPAHGQVRRPARRASVQPHRTLPPTPVASTPNASVLLRLLSESSETFQQLCLCGSELSIIQDAFSMQASKLAQPIGNSWGRTGAGAR